MLKPSRYNIFVPLLDGRRLAYNALSGAFGVLEIGDWGLYEEIERGSRVEIHAAEELLSAGFVLHDDIDEIRELRSIYDGYRFDVSRLLLTVAPTMACNFGCDYCFQGADKPSQSMSVAVQDEIVSFVDRASEKVRGVHVAWYGGEPLMRKDIVDSLSQRLIARCEERGCGYDAMVVTNGYLLSEAALDMLSLRRVGTVQVTLDGPERQHDKRRGLLSGSATFQKIVENLSRAVERGTMAFSVRVNVDRRNTDGILELLDELAARGFGGRSNFSVYFAPVEAITAGCHAVEEHSMVKTEYARKETALYREAFARQLSSLPYPPRFKGVCGAVRPNGFVVLPTGLVHKCWDTVSIPDKAIGNIIDIGIANDSVEAQKWSRWTPFDNAFCASCKLLPSCAGSCAYKFLYPEDTRGEQASLPCPSWKYDIKERLVARAERMGAIAASDCAADALKTQPCDLQSGPEPKGLSPWQEQLAGGTVRRRFLPVVGIGGAGLDGGP